MRSWTDKLDQGHAVVKPTPRTIGDVVEGQAMLVPTARQVDDFIRSIPPGVKVDVRVPLSEITPFWQVVDGGTPTTKRLTFGTELLKQQRAKEGLD